MKPEDPAGALRESAKDPEAFARFYDAHAEAVLAYFARRVLDPDLALDLTAETFAQAYLGRRRFRGSSQEAAAGWLYKIAKRQLNRYLRKGAADQRALRRLGMERPRLSTEDRTELETVGGIADVRSALRLELRRLSNEQRDALQLRVLDELPYGEVAHRLGISEQAARARVSRGLKALAAALNTSPRKPSNSQEANP